ncbi:16S rRNA G1207 methylase RsmC [Deinobacterium chartae]|uniref:16S rRNA G1207 methylase RsmC n=1 Tax=Deinobacterium chartae TaxID=521158 RepID=A0A841HUI8_9DEIO|nr:methyltransferase [Deinobacterium chartae]MBB6097121.1 16S rRNA G1207 methylase RsmC [Deinobacterium chartae]
MNTTLHVPGGGDLELRRYPLRRNEQLQAWDSADELILQHLQPVDLEGRRVLILNDAFGALSCALRDFDVTTYTDSFVGMQAIGLNLQRNPGQGAVRLIHDLSDLSGTYDLVLLRPPKNLSFLEDLLCRLSSHLHPASRLVCGVMVKHQSRGAFELIGRIIGETRTSLAHKKARLIFADFQREPTASPHPRSVSLEGFDLPFVHHSNLFSREKLDIGTRFFLEHLPAGNFETILDLGCANGAVGVRAKQQNPAARVIFSDDSYMAVLSARANFARHFPGDPAGADFVWTNCYEDGPPQSLDLVLCNPPFHQGTTVGDFIARQMFSDAHRALRPGGLLRVIGNAHLGYPQELRRIFGNGHVIATNPKFLIVDARKR